MRIILTSLLLMLGCSGASADSSIRFHQEQLGNIFSTAEDVRFAVETRGEAVEWVVTDFFDDEIARGSERVSAGRADIGPLLTGNGYFEIKARAFDSGREVGSARASFAVIKQRVLPVAPDAPFGVMTHFAQGWETDLIELISRAGIRHVRDEQYWAGVERNRGEYAFPPRYTVYMAALRSRGLEPLVALTFENKNYDGGLSPYSDDGRAGYAEYARAVLDQYGRDVRALEVWNEYNGTFCKGPCRFDRAGYYAKMLDTAYRRIKAVRPDVTVLGGAAVLVPLPWFEALFRLGALGYMDAVVIHPYRPVPEGVERDVAALNELIARFNGGQPKPIWATETGRQDHGPQGRHNVARYLVRMYTLLMASGVERIYWYLMRDHAGFRTMGLVRARDSELGRYAPAPAYAAYANLIHQLGGARFVRREHTDPRTRAYLFERTHDEIRVIWSPDSAVELRLSTNLPITVVDIMGRERLERPRGGIVALTADENPIYVHGSVTSISEVGRERLLADAIADYSVAAQGHGNWYYGYFTDPEGARARETQRYRPEMFVALEPTVTRWAHRWGHPTLPTLAVEERNAHPASSPSGPTWAIRRWRSTYDGQLRIAGRFARASDKGDGTSVKILLEGRPIFEASLPPRKSAEAAFNVVVGAVRGMAVDFVVTPGPDRNIDFDATSLSAVLTAVPGGAK